MAAVHANSHRFLSQVWFIVAAFFIASLFVGWKAYAAIQEIASHTTSMSTQMSELMDVRHK